MRRTNSVQGVALVSLLSLAIGCGGGMTTADTGMPADTGMTTDTGTSVDTGTRPDVQDAGIADTGSMDAGTDTGAVVADSGPDVAIVTDTPVVRDASGTDAGGPLPVSITIMTMCPAYAPCGGDPTGTWDYSGGCVDDPFPQVRAACPTATVTGATLTAQGRLTLAAGAGTRTAMLRYAGTVNLPVACTFGDCNAVQTALRGSLDSATCTMAAGGACSCDVVATGRTDGAFTYTTAGNLLTITSAGTDTQYDYCVTAGMGGRLSYRGRTRSTTDPGTFELTRAR